MHCCKSLVFRNAYVWVKAEGDPNFELTMDSEDL